MARNFGRYKHEIEKAVRQPDVTGQAYHEQVKRTREMLRSMTPEKALQIIEFHKGLNLFEALALAQREGKLIVPNDIHDGILTKTTDQEYLKQNYPVWTGTLVICEAPDKKFGEQVVSRWKDDNDVKCSISFTVPKQFRGLRNCALVIEHPDFEFVKIEVKPILRKIESLLKNIIYSDYEIKLVRGANIQLIENFPKKDDWHLTDRGIPIGTIVASSKDLKERSSPDCSDRTTRLSDLSDNVRMRLLLEKSNNAPIVLLDNQVVADDDRVGILSPRATSLLGDRERSSRDLSKGQTDRDRRLRDARRLRRNNNSYIGSVARAYDYFKYTDRRDIFFNDRPSSGLSVAFIQLATMPKRDSHD